MALYGTRYHVKPMDYSLIISVFSLMISVVAVIISYTTLQRDRYRIKVTWTPVESDREILARVYVRNHGKRPVDIVSVSAEKQGEERKSRSFVRRSASEIRIEEGQSFETHIRSGDHLHLWDTLEELKNVTFAVTDALGREYRAEKA